MNVAITAKPCRSLLYVGVGDDADERLQSLSDQYQLFQADNGDWAFDWLQARSTVIADYDIPYAIICDLQWLISDDFRFARHLAQHPDLCHVPLIALARKHRPFDKSMLTAHGIDDVYAGAFSWAQLEARLEFLNQYKPKLLEYARAATPQNWSMPIPAAKRIFDILVALAALPIMFPFAAMVAAAIAIESPGPVFYRSKRVGTGYRIFDFLKFRSMYADADRRLQDLAHMNQYQGNGPKFVKIVRDPRVTRVGRFIRKYSIDEWPQIFNILRGDMSVVGNRPLPLYEAQQLTKEEYCARFLAPAGLTGLWQVSKRGRSDMDAEERIALDIAYATNPYSVWRDLKIVLQTCTAFIQKEDV